MAAMPTIQAQVQTQARTSAQQVNVPITVTGINVTSITRDATTGALNLVGTLTGTILGQALPTPIPFTGTITPARNARNCPDLDLHLDPIHLSLLGLNVDTSAICLNITARRGGGLLGNLLCGGLNNVLTTAGTDTTAAVTQLNGVLNNSQVLGAANRVLAQARDRLVSFAPAQGTTCPVLNLALGPVRLNLLGLNVRLDNCANGPITVNITATQNGGLLGDLLCGLTGTGTGLALIQQINGVLQQITNTTVPVGTV